MDKSVVFNGDVNAIQIGFKNYTIDKPKEIPSVAGCHQNTECYGMHRYDDSTILIANKYEQDDKNCTFIHEMVHGICCRFGLRELNGDESTIDLLALGFYEAIRDNPHIFLMADI